MERKQAENHKHRHQLNLRRYTGFWHGTYYSEGVAKPNEKKLKHGPISSLRRTLRIKQMRGK